MVYFNIVMGSHIAHLGVTPTLDQISDKVM